MLKYLTECLYTAFSDVIDINNSSWHMRKNEVNTVGLAND